MRSYLLILFVICLFCWPLRGQQKVIDSLQIVLKHEKNNQLKASILIDIGQRYLRTQIYYDSAFFYTEKAVDLARVENLDAIEAHALFNLGIISNSIDNYESAIDYYTKSGEILFDLKRLDQIGSVYNNIGGSYFELGKYEDAIDSYEQALEIAVDSKDTISMAIDYMNIGEADYILGRLEKSKRTFEMALGLISDTEFDPSTIHLFYARTLFALGNLNASEKVALKALQISESQKDLKMISESSELLSKIFAKNNNFEKAYVYHDKFSVYKDSLNTAKELNEIEKLNLNFELNEKRKELAYISQENIYQNIIYFLAIAGLVLLGILVSRQLKIVRMTREIRDVQNRLVTGELKQRELLKYNKQATIFQATLEQDKENDQDL